MREPLCTLTVPPDVDHVSLVRSCVRDLVPFADEDASSSFLIAVTEVFVNAVRASLRHPDAPSVTIELWPGPPAGVAIVDRAGGIDPGTSDPDGRTDTLGLGLTIARSFVPALTIEAETAGTRVVLNLDAPS